MEKKRQMQQVEAQLGGEPEEAEEGESALSDHEDSGLPTQGKNRFDTLLKTLIARIEFNNTLAPIQEYGRHQQKAANKKKNKKKQLGGNEASETPSVDKYDDNYYDLDDEFINDEEVEMLEQDDDLLYGDGETSKFLSGAASDVACVAGD